MNESNSTEGIDKTNLTNQTKFRLDEINKIKNYFIEEINQRKSCSKKLSKYVAVFDYIDQAFIVLNATSGGVSIISFTSIVGVPWNSKCKSYFIFLSNNRNSKKITKYNKKKRKRKSMIKFLCWLNENSIAWKL